MTTRYLFTATLMMACSGDADSPALDTSALIEDTSVPVDSGSGDTGSLPDYDSDGSPDEEDCADVDPTIYPGADEIPYDGIDQDCDGWDLTDVDDDGYDAEKVGGEDCDDNDPHINPDAIDVVNDVDDDCDGELDEGDDTIPEGWPISFGGDGTLSSIHVGETPTGQKMVAGAFSGTIDFDPFEDEEEISSEGDTEIFVVRFREQDRFRWLWIGRAEEALTLNDMYADPDGYTLIAGSFSATANFDETSKDGVLVTSNGGEDAFVSRINETGVPFWVSSWGGEGADRTNAVFGAVDGSVFATGDFEDTVSFDPGEYTAQGQSDAFVVSISAGGHQNWVAPFGGSKGTASGLGVVEDASGNVIVAGTFTGTVDLDPGDETLEVVASGEKDVFVVALSSDGEWLWSTTLSGSGSVSVADLTVDESGAILVGGFDETLDLEPGESENLVESAGEMDGYVLWLDGSGNARHAEVIGGQGVDEMAGVMVGSTGQVVASGTFEDEITLSGQTLSSDGETDIMTVCWDDNQSLSWLFRLGNDMPDVSSMIAPGSDGEVLMSGVFTGSLDLDPGAAVDERDANGDASAWSLEVDASGPN